MPEKQIIQNRFVSFVVNNLLSVGILVVVMFLIVPPVKQLIDVAMVLNIAVSFVLLLTVINMKRAADFTSFPRVTLIATIFGLAINVSSTRNILANPVTSNMASGMNGQSEIVKSFAAIVAGNNVLIGLVVFIILTVVQVVVISKGAERVSEVTARFTLDAMNTKKFGLQTKLNNGSITQEEFEELDGALDREIDFYATMDGASKFVSGNIKAGIFITVVNLLAGMATGMIYGHISFVDAFNSYGKLTIGDGLTSQLPSLILSFSTGLLITANNDGSELTDQLKQQFSQSGNIYIIVGAVLAVLGIAFHNGSSAVFIILGAIFVFVGNRLSKTNKKKAEEAELAKQNNGVVPKKTGPEEISPIAKVDELSLELGYAFIPLVEDEKGAELKERVKRIRRETALDLGIVIPAIHIMDDMKLPPEEYSFKIRGIEVGHGRIKMGYFMCLNTGGVPKDKEIPGEKTKDPAFGMDAVWIPESKRLEAEKAGYAVIDAPTTIATHLTELIRRNASSILTRQSVSAILEEVKKTNDVIVSELLTEHKFNYGEIEAVLRNLLLEQVSIRNLVTILETLGDQGKYTHDPWVLSEKVRESLGAQICLQYCDDQAYLHVFSLSQKYAAKISEYRFDDPGTGPMLNFEINEARKFTGALSNALAQISQRGYPPVLMVPSHLRRAVKWATEREMPGLVVLSVNEVITAGNKVKLDSIGEIDG